MSAPYINRELSWVEFNQRVLNEALREDLPLTMVPEPARRRKDVEYIFINRPEWVDFKPISDTIKKAMKR